MDLQITKIVLPIEIHHEGKKVRLSKPQPPFSPPNPHHDRYIVDGDRVHIKYGHFPVYFLIAGSGVMCLGFAKYPWCPPKICQPGPCGECFSFTVDAAQNAISIENTGKPYKWGYRWYLWTAETGKRKRLPIDPRVYNYGETETWPPLRKLALFTRLWRFLTRRAPA